MKKHWTEVGKERFNLHPSKLNLTKEFNLSEKIFGQINMLQKDLKELENYRKNHLKSAVKGIIELQNEAAISNLKKLGEDVKEFIRLLKERIAPCDYGVNEFCDDKETCESIRIIDKLAGDKLKC